jgi:hypothetical protein
MPRPFRLVRPRLRTALLGLAAFSVLGGALLLGCSPPQPALREQIQLGDRQREWGRVYYQSWQKERNRDYLILARQSTQEAVRLYLDVQRRMGYQYPDFYIVDRRRTASCVFLRQMQVEATSLDVQLDETKRVGCYD